MVHNPDAMDDIPVNDREMTPNSEGPNPTSEFFAARRLQRKLSLQGLQNWASGDAIADDETDANGPDPDSSAYDSQTDDYSSNSQSVGASPQPSLGSDNFAPMGQSPGQQAYARPPQIGTHPSQGQIPVTGNSRSRASELAYLDPTYRTQPGASSPRQLPTDPSGSTVPKKPGLIKRLLGQKTPTLTPPTLTPPGASIGLPGITPEGLPQTPGAFSLPVPPAAPRLWEKRPYSIIVHVAAITGTATGAWLFGILVAQVLPGNVTAPPLQEVVLRKSSRLAQRLWHFSELWHTPTAQTRIEPIPLPETGPVLAPISLPPIERQPLVDELNTIETEIITLDRRLQTLEKRLGRPPYQGTDIDSRLNALRDAIDPPRNTPAKPTYSPKPTDPAERLLEVAKLHITLPSDALFAPGQAQVKETDLLHQVLDQIINYPKATIVIRSHSDNQASTLESRKYTLDQANALSGYLQSTLPNSYRWVTVGSGQSQPVASNDDAAKRQQNRRIEILVDTR